MYKIGVWALLLVFTWVLSCETDMSGEMVGVGNRFPDFSKCECDFASREVVCDATGNWFRSACFASCKGYEGPFQELGECKDTVLNSLDTLTWPIHLVCHPVEPLPPIVAHLSDSTVIFQTDSNTFIRGIPFPFCRCLSSDTRISTVHGEIPINQLEIGDSVYTKNMAGDIDYQPLIKISKVPVRVDHKVLYMGLADGRNISATPEHPDQWGTPLESLQIGDSLDGSKIVHKRIHLYEGSFTWDILPAGETGVYLANGMWMGSTLKQDLPLYIP